MSLKKNKKPIILTIVILAVLTIGYMLLHRGEEYTDNAALEAHVVTISPKIAGYVKTLRMEDNQYVKAGDVLLEIDPYDYEIRRNRAVAALDAAKAAYSASGRNLETTMVSAPSALEGAQAQLESATANWRKAAGDLKRIQSLSKAARSREQLDAVVAAEKSARATLEDTKAKLQTAQTSPHVIASAKASSESLAAQVKIAQAELELAENDLANTKIVAMQDGRITHRSVEQGDYVQPGQQLGFLTGTEIWVIANYKETQLKKMRVGDKADIKVDAFPNLKVTGKVQSVAAGTGIRFSAFPPENATGNFIKIVQRVPVKILLDAQPDSPLPLGAGMSVEPTVYTK